MAQQQLADDALQEVGGGSLAIAGFWNSPCLVSFRAKESLVEGVSWKEEETTAPSYHVVHAVCSIVSSPRPVFIAGTLSGDRRTQGSHPKGNLLSRRGPASIVFYFHFWKWCRR